MSNIDDQRHLIEREIAEIDNRIAEMQAEGRDNADEAIQNLLDTRAKLRAEMEIVGDAPPIDRTDREDPVTGRDLAEQTQEEAVVHGLRRR